MGGHGATANIECAFARAANVGFAAVCLCNKSALLDINSRGSSRDYRCCTAAGIC